MNRPQQHPDKFPPENGKVGDTVLFVLRDKTPAIIHDRKNWTGTNITIETAKIVGVGFVNEHGYPLNVEVQFEGDASTAIVCALHAGFHYVDEAAEQTEGVLILCPQEEQPDELQEWAEKNNVVVARHPAAQPAKLSLRCGSCLGEISRKIVYEEIQSLSWWRDDFSLDKPELSDSEGSGLFCETCEEEFEMPEAIEDYA